MARRGSYAKGVAKREEILDVALDVVAREGYRRTTVRVIADAVGLSQPGLLHHFGSKEELFTEVLRKRDQVDLERYGPADPAALVRVMRHNAEVPGLAQLYAQLSADAIDPGHPAHGFFRERYRAFSAAVAGELRARQAAGTFSDEVDPDRIVRVVIAIADGIQSQWLLDSEVDMAGHIQYALELLGVLGEPADPGD